MRPVNNKTTWSYLASRYAHKHGLPPHLFVRQMRAESGFDPNVIYGRRNSSAGAEGIAQFMPGTARGLGINPLKPRQALDAAAGLMSKYWHQFGSYDKALRAYNAGPGGVQKSYGYSQTNNYVAKILGGKDVSPGSHGGGGGPRHQPSLGGGGRSPGGMAPHQPAQDFTGMRQSLLLNYVDQQNNPDALLNLALGMRSIVDQQQQQPSLGFTGGGRGRGGGGGGGGGQGASGPVLGRAKPGRPDLATSVGGLHPTMGLPGYPAHDYFAPAHSPVVAPVSGKVIRLSGHPPSAGPVEGPHGPLGWSVYIQGNDGRTYYLTHMGTRTVRAGQRVRQGQRIGTVANYAKYGTPNHIHMGVHG